ncbi:hypothetical protein BDZ90DRAFT_229341 [Jaminaea rosea]|uniref:Transcription and mRNA export factor SUS1 n=1 Tax=Jaminaea rosea TaxID=1569628 RepID=A0A316UYE4_9BASI|nr:hypothetical protein BDZ90DRAFT_229341 [Jaminaea rosea]PWN30320.1 hypothetical protein BDZ90DRAFT_229341 [Jaminaea rosea]
MSDTDDLYQALHHRLITTGEWHRLSNLLEQLLLDSRWSSDMADYATQKAQSMDNLNLDDLVAAVQAKGQKSVPKQVQTQLLEKIRDFLDRNVEDA